MSKLLGCPFCGKKPEMSQREDGCNDLGQYIAYHTISCNRCGIYITKISRFFLVEGSVVFKVNGYEECIEVWNRRADNGTVC